MKSLNLLIAVLFVFAVLNVTAQSNATLQPVLNSYVALKDALVKTDAANASLQAKDLLTAIEAVKSNELSNEANEAWAKSLKDLKEDAEHISETKEISHQRDHFMSLSKNMYQVIKVSKMSMPVYYQYCPMANKGKGANWLSFENKVKNPYYGNQMLTCGKVVETIQ